MAEQKRLTPEEELNSFRENLIDVLPLLEGLQPHCTTIQDAIGMCQLAIDNEGQAKLLVAMFKNQKAK